MKKICGGKYLLENKGQVFQVFQVFEKIENQENLEILILYSKNTPVDFQGERSSRRNSTDF